MFTFTAFGKFLPVANSCMSLFSSESVKYLSVSFSVFSLQFFNGIFWPLNSAICSKTAFLSSLFLVVVAFFFFWSIHHNIWNKKIFSSIKFNGYLKIISRFPRKILCKFSCWVFLLILKPLYNWFCPWERDRQTDRQRQRQRQRQREKFAMSA